MSRSGLQALVVASTLALGSTSLTVTAGEAGGYFDLTLGGGMVDSPSGSVDLEAQSALGLQFSWTREGWPVHVVLSGVVSEDDADNPYVPYPPVEDVVSVLDLGVGVRKYFGRGRLRPFAGLGVSLFLADRELYGVLDDDEDLGTWVEGGFVWPIRHWHLGLAARASRASVVLHGDEIEGGTSVHVIWGSHW